jgi:deazaflavin-dependent oxidoreductase (nitroreductase family)
MSEDHRPSTVAEKQEFSSGGRTGFILLRGRWGLAIDRAVLWLTGYSLMTKQYCMAQRHPYQPTLLLTTIGARTGRKRTCGLPFFKVGDDLVVRGSNGGGPTDPHWVHNIRANGDARIRFHWRSRAVKAHVASGEERERIYARLSKMSDSTEMYQKMCAPRELPLVVLRDPTTTQAS